jgi:hypothetical protein
MKNLRTIAFFVAFIIFASESATAAEIWSCDYKDHRHTNWTVIGNKMKPAGSKLPLTIAYNDDHVLVARLTRWIANQHSPFTVTVVIEKTGGTVVEIDNIITVAMGEAPKKIVTPDARTGHCTLVH